MKIMIEVIGGVVSCVTATQECSIYLIDHDNLKERGEAPDARSACQPDRITWEGGHIAQPGGSETPEFDRYLNEALAEYEQEGGGI
jgi:hypothetical protein